MAEGEQRTRLRLRARLTLAFGLSALLTSMLLAGVTYGLTRDNLLDRRETDARVSAFRNAGRVEQLITDETDEEGLRQILGSMSTVADATPAIRLSGFGTFDWISGDTVAFGAPADIHLKLQEMVSGPGDTPPGQMRYQVDGVPHLVIAIPIAPRDGIYLEAVPLGDIEHTLSSLALALLGASALTTLAGISLGAWASRRVLAPLADVSNAAEALARGDLSARLEVGGDRDLAQLADSFNEMAANLEARLKRDAEFASNVSHELRSPLMTIMASAEILNSRRDELSERSQTALHLLNSDLERFRRLVQDLLEISRYDTTDGSIEPDYFGIVEFVTRVAEDVGFQDVPISHPPEMETTVVAADKRRMARVIANLLENAANYGGGPTSIQLKQREKTVEIAIEDAGPGVPIDERQTIFGRFTRGSEGGRRGAGTGSGLGLALVVEHVRLHGGRVFVEDRPDGLSGARFVVQLPVVTDE